MNFQQGHPLLKMVIEDIALNFNGNEWGTNGPLALTKHIMAINKDPCLFQIMKTKDFLSKLLSLWQKIFDPKQMEEVLKTVNGSYVLHYWGKLSLEADISDSHQFHDF
ncbi:Uncharacterized protein FKW44_007660 [Caligus rogercresseyi]|uniref:Alpha 1,4-glycosyltransferase domain-containing protein n=1 Tax=Caligus rogercresseyi TaxID=217165 RepID=A0A7T8KF15_CALRO|nr:Uncharacterized protein FKW44_007660 [Caligus rogercresseyi]